MRLELRSDVIIIPTVKATRNSLNSIIFESSKSTKSNNSTISCLSIGPCKILNASFNPSKFKPLFPLLSSLKTALI